MYFINKIYTTFVVLEHFIHFLLLIRRLILPAGILYICVRSYMYMYTCLELINQFAKNVLEFFFSNNLALPLKAKKMHFLKFYYIICYSMVCKLPKFVNITSVLTFISERKHTALQRRL